MIFALHVPREHTKHTETLPVSLVLQTCLRVSPRQTVAHAGVSQVSSGMTQARVSRALPTLFAQVLTQRLLALFIVPQQLEPRQYKSVFVTKVIFGMTKRVYSAERAFSAPKEYGRNVLQTVHRHMEASTPVIASV